MAEKKPTIPPDAMRYMTLGVEFIAIFMVCLTVGLWLDGRWRTMPVFTMVGMVVGFAGAMYRIMRVARDYERGDGKSPADDDDEDE